MLAFIDHIWHRLQRFGHNGPWQEPKWRLDDPMTLSPPDVKRAMALVVSAQDWLADIIVHFPDFDGDAIDTKEVTATAEELDSVICFLRAAQVTLVKGIDRPPPKGYTGM